MNPDPRKNGERQYTRRDTIVIGASAGGVSALKDVVRGLPSDLPAALLVVMHVPGGHRSLLPEILTRAGKLPARHAQDGEPIECGRIYVAPPDCHLGVNDGTLRVYHGPRINHLRPAADPLFKSAAEVLGPRVIGVVLSGFLDDGTAGLHAIKLAGGISVVQDPEQTTFPSMPENAMRTVDVDHVVASHEMGPLLARLTSEEIPAVMDQDDATGKPIRLDHRTPTDGYDGAPAYSCPDCGGVLRETTGGELVHYRCRVGHEYSPDGLLTLQSETVEEALWTALRAMEERAEVSRRLATRARAWGREGGAAAYEHKATKIDESAAVIRGLLETDHEPIGDEAPRPARAAARR